ncbi:hypothetical protein KFE25_008658 [Diacronema lutheri]|uniref:DUF218 domain-containing protein n=1 Tax=Diacronema lutheri TaxID=2081491 RepID=A0A8J5XXA8_DIALT|nr:hypothetical protein KFE25_008658 [Diacronema lutheri]
MKQVVVTLALVATVLTLGGGMSRGFARAFDRPDVVLVLAGGVDRRGATHCTVAERLRAAANASKALGGCPVVLNGGGTTWKPRYVDRNGFSIPEAALMAVQLEREGGLRHELLYPESFSDDTIGNAFFARVMHTDLRPEWRDLLVITSQFQMARTQAIYTWIFSLEPRPAARPYRLRFESVRDDCLDPHVLALRRAKEADSLHKLEAGPLMRMRTLAEAHEFIFRRHSGYSVRGVTSKQPLDSALADTY